jgi:hypothetical protein
MAQPTRETARDALAALLTSSLSGVCQAVYAYQVGDFEKRSPVVVITGASAQRERESYGGTYWATTFRYDIHSFVLYTQGTTWTEADAEDAIDDIEQAIAGMVDSNTSGTIWDYLSFAGETQMDSVIIGGEEYKHERIPVQVRI